ncbi:cytochrome c oxidase subunit I [Bordetella sp. 02P26C-1]|uniref:cytochrome c oxidase subunit I n=1 Tax=Bordetella sp. 02P26C-1 TaxID=2683195 RepID=UPI0013558BCE|nr:cytochrome c oxidase subunit I [Bordetella sp. 02P26C-1]MVW78275.1 cytochrome c oxidase subunit I [Bordetella sp. 02P26C-1]
MSENLSPVTRHKALEADWRSPPGWRGLSAVNHSTVGRRFIVAALIFFLIGGVLAMLMRAQLATPGQGPFDSEAYNQIFTMHGTVMMFLFAIPMLEGFAFYLLPKMLGARDMAYPRLGAYGWWCYLFGGLILMVGMALGVAPNSGWFMYTPLSSTTYQPGINNDIWLIGITFAEISAVCGAIELIGTILKLRAPGMSLGRMPIFAWYMLVTAGMILIGFPPLILGSILLELERAFGMPFFDVARGGDPLLWQHLFWIFGHPEVYIIFLPAAGMVATMVPVFARHPLVGYSWVVAAVAAMGVLSFGLWVHHMFTVGIPQMAVGFFSAASMLVAVPTAVQFFAWLATLWSGKVQYRLPMLYLGGFLFIFVLGGLTGVMLALVPFNWQAHDTHFVVAHMHYVLIGGMIFPVLAATCYWLPHFTGRLLSERAGPCAFWLIFIGFNVTFLPMHLTGLLGMPRRIYAYDEQIGWDVLNLVSSIGGFIQTIGFAVFLIDIVLHLRAGRLAPPNPWRASTLEWAMPTPPPVYNFASIPSVQGREPLWDVPDLGAQAAGGKHWLAEAAPGRRQTLSVDVVSGRAQSVVELPGPTWLPLYAALATAVFFICVLFKIYAVAAVGVGIALAVFLRWAWLGGARQDPQLVQAAPSVQLPTHVLDRGAPGWWGMCGCLAADAALYASLLFGFLFLRTMAPEWPPAQWLVLSPWQAGLLALAPIAAAFACQRACAVNRHGRDVQREGWMLASAALAAVSMALFGAIVMALPAADSHAYAAAATVLAYYMMIHTAVGFVMALFVALRGRAGYVSQRRELELRVVRLWQIYTALAAVVASATLFFIPHGLPS